MAREIIKNQVYGANDDHWTGSVNTELAIIVGAIINIEQRVQKKSKEGEYEDFKLDGIENLNAGDEFRFVLKLTSEVDETIKDIRIIDAVPSGLEFKQSEITCKSIKRVQIQEPSNPSEPEPNSPSEPEPNNPSEPEPNSPSEPEPNSPSEPEPNSPSEPEPSKPSEILETSDVSLTFGTLEPEENNVDKYYKTIIDIVQMKQGQYLEVYIPVKVPGTDTINKAPEFESSIVTSKPPTSDKSEGEGTSA